MIFLVAVEGQGHAAKRGRNGNAAGERERASANRENDISEKGKTSARARTYRRTASKLV